MHTFKNINYVDCTFHFMNINISGEMFTISQIFGSQTNILNIFEFQIDPIQNGRSRQFLNPGRDLRITFCVNFEAGLLL